ncbi:MAG: FAD-binding protein, partial [Flavobacteriales bacterium]
MIKEFQLQVLPEQASETKLLINIVAEKLQIEKVIITHLEILKRSVDARQRIVKINLKLRVFISEKYVNKKEDLPIYNNANGKEEVII